MLACKSPFSNKGVFRKSRVHDKYPWAASQAKDLPGQRKGKESLLPDSQRRMKDCPDWQWVTQELAESLKGNQRPDYTSQVPKRGTLNQVWIIINLTSEPGLDNYQPHLKKQTLIQLLRYYVLKKPRTWPNVHTSDQYIDKI